MVRLLALLCATLFFVALAVLLLSATFAMYFWPTPYRYLALWLMVLLYLILGGVSGWMMRRGLRDRSEGRRVGKEGVRTCNTRWSPSHENKTCPTTTPYTM